MHFFLFSCSYHQSRIPTNGSAQNSSCDIEHLLPKQTMKNDEKNVNKTGNCHQICMYLFTKIFLISYGHCEVQLLTEMKTISLGVEANCQTARIFTNQAWLSHITMAKINNMHTSIRQPIQLRAKIY